MSNKSPSDKPEDQSFGLIDDAYIAQHLRVSRGWVRTQRFRRRHALSHVFNVDPIYIGSLPRYFLQEVLAWVQAQR